MNGGALALCLDQECTPREASGGRGHLGLLWASIAVPCGPHLEDGFSAAAVSRKIRQQLSEGATSNSMTTDE